MKHNTDIFILSILFILLSINIVAGEKNNKIVVLAGTDCSRCFAESLNDREREYIYTYNSEKNIFVKFSTIYRGTNTKVSPKGTYVAFWGTDKKDVPIYNRSGGWNKALQLQIFLANGKHIKSIPLPEGDIVWSPGEDRIVFIECPYVEMKSPENKPIWLIDLTSLKKIKLPERGDKVTWAEFDNNIYYNSSDRRKVVRYDPIKNTLASTNYRGTKFCHSGQYYLSSEPPIRVYERKTNREITSEVFSAIKRDLGPIPINDISRRWDDFDNLVLCNSSADTTYLFSLKKMAIIQQFAGYLLNVINTSTREAVIESQNKISKIKIRTN